MMLERRAQLVGDVVDEVDLELIGRLRGFFALRAARAPHYGIGHVLEGHQRGAVRKRHGGAVDHVAVGPLDPADDRFASSMAVISRPQHLPDLVVA